MKLEALTTRNSWRRLRFSSVVVFIVFSALTLLVWWRQVEHQQTLLNRHTHDVCVQAAQRLRARIESRMRTANIFARRWASHEGGDFSRQRFTAFSTVLISELSSFHSVRLIRPSREPDWLLPAGVDSSWQHLGPRRRQLLHEAKNDSRGLLSAPVRHRQGGTRFFAAFRLARGVEHLGFMVVEFRSDAMIGAVFHQHIRDEFTLSVRDGAAPLLRVPQDAAAAEDMAGLTATQRFTLRNRTWTVTISPRPEQIAFSGWSASRSIPLLGLFLTLGMSLLVHLLSRRIALYREARDRALIEIEEREQAQTALKKSEARYRSIFNSTTDGLLIIGDGYRIIEANPAAGSMHGYEPGELEGRPYRDLIIPGSAGLHHEFTRQLEQDGKATLDSVHATRGGGTIEVVVRGTKLDCGDHDCALIILTDVSDLRRAVSRHKMLARKVLVAQEEERARVSRDLHDELGQVLTALRLELDMLRRKDGARCLHGSIDRAVEMLEAAAKELRHICKGLRPPLLDDLGLEPSIRYLVEEFEQRNHTLVDLEVLINKDERTPPMEVALSTYRILQEVLNNISRHANARAVSIELAGVDSELSLSVVDDGQGFDKKEMMPGGGYGLAGMHERSSLVGGTLEIRSEPLQGTRVQFRVPLEKDAGKVSDDAHPDRG